MSRSLSWSGFGSKVAQVLPQLQNPLNYKQRRRLSNITKQLGASNSAQEKTAESYPEPADTKFIIDYQDLRETVKSVWRKKHSSEVIKIIAFVIPKGEQTPADYVVLPNGNYHTLLEILHPNEGQCVFYELEDTYNSTNKNSVLSSYSTDTTLFNEFIVVPFPSDNFDQCPIKLNSIVFV
ncbi:hypothetical protein COEREDRAFT_90043 [Coemansia reversa NRRL 1564]|uniref:Uncharacterized protein n=1 Tax=Coemansia reversa (strain ATCC 12441 / NRRL 1564) TaxID=763665 RepID=A0A2G5B1A3_COERN|nr:hypothetical protein COEREDRAFT_90043 [Coemansia reversa NRRL 1564]|eukprot:PIA12793.1 hypothetical protein COEREDRAFT_90043 [Coemansia reversa NRRL 1564]